MDKTSCPCLAERPPSAPATLGEVTDQYGTFVFGPKYVDLRQVLSKRNLSLLHRIRTAPISERSTCENDEGVEPGFSCGYDEARQEEEQDVPLLKGGKLDRDEQSRSNELRAELVREILDVDEDKLSGLSREEAIEQFEAKKMVRAYYRSDECLQCATLVDNARTDLAARRRLERIAALFTTLGGPLPVGLQDWESCKPYRSSKEPRRPTKNSNRDQRISFAIHVLVFWTGSSQYRAFQIVSKVWDGRGSIVMSPDDVKKIWKRHKRTYE